MGSDVAMPLPCSTHGGTSPSRRSRRKRAWRCVLTGPRPMSMPKFSSQCLLAPEPEVIRLLFAIWFLWGARPHWIRFLIASTSFCEAARAAAYGALWAALSFDSELSVWVFSWGSIAWAQQPGTLGEATSRVYNWMLRHTKNNQEEMFSLFIISVALAWFQPPVPSEQGDASSHVCRQSTEWSSFGEVEKKLSQNLWGRTGKQLPFSCVRLNFRDSQLHLLRLSQVCRNSAAMSNLCWERGKLGLQVVASLPQSVLPACLSLGSSEIRTATLPFCLCLRVEQLYAI